MKKIILLLAFICAGFASQAQSGEQETDWTQGAPLRVTSVGDHLTQAGQSYAISLSVFVIGSAATAMIEKPDTKVAMMVGTSIVGLAFAYVGCNHLVLAGRQANNLSVGIGGEGLSMVYRFK